MNANKHEFGKSGESKTIGFEMRSKKFAQKTKKFGISNTEKIKRQSFNRRVRRDRREEWDSSPSRICEKKHDFKAPRITGN
jgi:hypothetical protein